MLALTWCIWRWGRYSDRIIHFQGWWIFSYTRHQTSWHLKETKETKYYFSDYFFLLQIFVISFSFINTSCCVFTSFIFSLTSFLYLISEYIYYFLAIMVCFFCLLSSFKTLLFIFMKVSMIKYLPMLHSWVFFLFIFLHILLCSVCGETLSYTFIYLHLQHHFVRRRKNL